MGAVTNFAPHPRALPDWSAVPSNSEEDRIFLNRRLAFFGRVIFFITFTFDLFSAGLQLTASSGAPSDRLRLSMAIDLAASAIFGLEWLLCRSGRRSPQQLNWIDVGCLIGGVGLYAVSSFSELRGQGLEQVYVQTAVCLAIVVTRAVIVPGTVRRTAWTSAAASFCLVLLAWHATRFLPPELLERRPQVQVVLVVYFAGWTAVVVAISTLVSRVIYGLSERVRAVSELGQYTLEEKLGEGGMGVVYKARHALLRRPTAVKLLPKELAGELSVKRFEREVQLTSVLAHPNTIAIYDYGHTPDGIFYYAMEYLDGVSLEELIELDGPQAPARVVHILRQICGALAEAHGVGLIHRDIKPANLMLCMRGGIPDHVKVVDFGLVKEIARDEATDVTNAGALVGTPAYLAPEAASHPESIDARADIYALGAVCYQLLAGAPVFEARTVVQMVAAHMYQDPIAPSVRSGRDVPPSLEQLILRCLAKNPAARPSSVTEILAFLDAQDDLPAWSESEALDWWGQRGEGLKQRAKSAPTDSDVQGPRTVAVDLKQRV
jgi:serine/threonine-protein kinase